jgi:hypothetical protein
MEQTLIRYIRNRRGEPRGVAVVLRDEDEICYGYSLCNPVDRWDKQKGLKIAVSRALSKNYDLPEAENTLKELEDCFRHLSNRAINYFKDLPKEKVEFIFND